MTVQMRELRKRLSMRLDDYWGGTLDQNLAADATLQIDHRFERASFFRNGWIYVGTDPSSEEKVIANSAPTSPQITTAASLSTTYSAGGAYEIHKRFSVDRYNFALLDALADSRAEAVLANLRYTALVWVANQHEYSLPTNFKYITGVEFMDAAGTNVEQGTHLSDLRVQPGIPKKLIFPRGYSPRVGATMRILGQGSEADPENTDLSYVVTDDAFILAHAELHLRATLAEQTGEIGAVNRTRLRDLAQTVELKRAAMVAQHRPQPNVLVVP